MTQRPSKTVTIKLQDGTDKDYVFQKFDALLGREVMTQYPLLTMTNGTKLGDYRVSEEIMLKLMTCVGVPRDSGEPLWLTTRALYQNHVPDWEAGAKIELGMIEFNASFFENGALLASFGGLATNFRGWIIKTLMDLSGALSKPGQRTGEPPLTN